MTLAAINLVLALMREGGPVSKLIDDYRAKGIPIPKEVWDELFAGNDEARSELVAAITRAEAEGR